jgi:DNA-directed RNA polymerase subunit E'
MYYLKTIEDKVRVPPQLFASDLNDALLNILKEKFEGLILKDIGLVLLVSNPEALSDGVVIPGDSGAYYTVRFDAVVFLPFVNEVYNGEVKELVEFGAFVSIGPLHGLLHISQISKEKFSYDKKAKTLVAKAEKRSLKKGDAVIVKVSTVSLKSTVQDTKIGLTMRPEGLGKFEWLEEEKKKTEEKKAKEKKEEKS